MTQQNPWSGFKDSLEDPPGTRAAYFSYGDKFGGSRKSPRQESFFDDQFSALYDKYLGTLGLQVRQGQMPTNQWRDYLSEFDFDKYYQQNQSFEQRNPQQRSFVPNTMWNVNSWLRGRG